MLRRAYEQWNVQYLDYMWNYYGYSYPVDEMVHQEHLFSP